MDPPYELEFMDRAWDRSGGAFDPDTWRAVYRVCRRGSSEALVQRRMMRLPARRDQRRYTTSQRREPGSHTPPARWNPPPPIASRGGVFSHCLGVSNRGHRRLGARSSHAFWPNSLRLGRYFGVNYLRRNPHFVRRARDHHHWPIMLEMDLVIDLGRWPPRFQTETEGIALSLNLTVRLRPVAPCIRSSKRHPDRTISAGGPCPVPHSKCDLSLPCVVHILR